MENVFQNNREMRGVWRHVLWDSLWRVKFMVAAALSVLLFLYSSRDQSLLVIPLVFTSSTLLGLAGAAYASAQLPVYPVLEILPMSRRTRGRLLWVQHIMVLPTLLFCPLMLLDTVQLLTMGGYNGLYLRWFGERYFFTGVLVVLALPAVLILLSKRWAPFALRPVPVLLLYVLLPVLPFVAIADYEFNQRLVTGPLCVVAAAALFMSYLQAPRVPITRGPKDTLQRHHSAWSRVVLPEQATEVVGFLFVAFCILLLPEPDEYPLYVQLEVCTSFFSGVMAMMGFFGAGQRAVARVRIMRTLPMTVETISMSVLKQALGMMFYACTLASLIVIGNPGTTWTSMANGLLLGACLGAFAPWVLFLGSGRPHTVREYMMATTALLVINSWPHTFMWPLFWVSPLAVGMAFWLLGRVLRHERAYQSHRQFDAAFRTR